MGGDKLARGDGRAHGELTGEQGGCGDLRHHRIRRTLVATLAIYRTTEVIDHYARTSPGDARS